MRSKRTIRRMKHAPIARKLAHIAKEAKSLSTRLDNMVDEVHDLELTARVYERALREHGWDTGKMGAALDEIEQEIGMSGEDTAPGAAHE